MEFTYLITLHSCESKPSLTAQFNEVPKERVQRAIDFAGGAFRDVEITCEQTGEVIYNSYKDADWFNPTCDYGMAIDILCHICYDEEF